MKTLARSFQVESTWLASQSCSCYGLVRVHLFACRRIGKLRALTLTSSWIAYLTTNLRFVHETGRTRRSPRVLPTNTWMQSIRQCVQFCEVTWKLKKVRLCRDFHCDRRVFFWLEKQSERWRNYFFRTISNWEWLRTCKWEVASVLCSRRQCRLWKVLKVISVRE